ncbi:LrgB family protein [Paenibacillus sp. J5C_2022]|uniref:LrgB family protein n=1 Tax=Paenibacillus sp. J5C2022 TaxID=2977129 RepID=UPI0021D25CD1|nr:LrgB family protein [Paenibacillus sp. J5C2022]MCU6708834.1 LrgB family protein [Paenibacillus sp. J5C2022]
MYLNHILHSPSFGLLLTLLCYIAFVWLKGKWKWRFIHPLIYASGAIMLIIWLSGLDGEAYKIGGDWISWGLGPATVALAVPLYKHAPVIRSKLGAVLAGITVGSVLSAAATAYLLAAAGASADIVYSAIAKSSSAPFSIEIASRLGGIPELAAAFSVLTGLFGSLAGPAFLRLCGIKSDIPIGAAVGTGSHGIGTARLMADSELQGSVSGFSMAFAGIVTSIMMIPIYLFQ